LNILNIGGATAIIEHKGIRILCDPWLDDGIFHGSWHHFPSANIRIEDLGHLDYIFISHIHEDHCSPGTIKHLSRDAELIIADRRPNLVLNFLEVYEFRFRKVHLVKPQTPYQLRDDLLVDIVTADPDHELNYLVDNGLILKWDDYVIYNANDCAPYDGSIEYILSTYEAIDFAMLPYAGGSSCPACFSNLSHEEKLDVKEQMFGKIMDDFISFTKRLTPKFVLPFADQYIIVGSNCRLNQYLSHPACSGVVKKYFNQDELSSKLVLLNSCQSFELETEQYSPQEDYQYFSDDDRNRYAEKFSHSKYDHELYEIRRSVPLERHLKIARDNLWSMQERIGFQPKYYLYVEISDWEKKYEIPLESNTITLMEDPGQIKDQSLSVKVSSTLLSMLLVGHVSWNIADAALFIEYHRIPNYYDPDIQTLWNYLKI
jgi:UDP-MurNAc hydroxylase